MSRHRAIVDLGILQPREKRAAREHLPRAEQERDAERDERKPEVREDEALAI